MEGVHSHPKFGKFKVARSSLSRIFLNFAKRCILSCISQLNNKKWGSLSLFFEL